MVDQVTFRTTDNLRWGAGQGSDLSASEIDINFWVLLTAVQALQAQSNDHAGIDHFVIVGTNLFVHLTNHNVLGPYVLPIAQWHFEGEWTARHAYQAFDVITQGGAVYLSLIAHVSQGIFSAGAGDDLGNLYYGLLLAAPDPELPQDGVLGQLLQWQTSPGDIRWMTPTRNIGFYLETAPDPIEVVMDYIFTEQTTFPVGLTGAQFSVGTRPTAVNQQFTLYQDGSAIGTVTYHNVGVATIVFASERVFNPGQILSVIGPTIPDAHMTRVRFNLVGLLP